MKIKKYICLLCVSILFCQGCGNTSTNEADLTKPAAAESKAATTVIMMDQNNASSSTVNGLNDGLCSCNRCGQDATTVAGDDYSMTPGIYVDNGSYSSEKSVAGKQDVSWNTGIADVSVFSDVRGTNGIIINNSRYSMEHVNVTMNTAEEDGLSSCDFSGKGAAMAVYGDSDVTVSNCKLSASGVTNPGLFVDNGASVLIENSNIHSNGGTLYTDYINTVNQSTMQAPPWILGIMGNSRASNLMGTNSTLTLIDSRATASNWAVLSTDFGNNMVLNVANSTLSLTGTELPMQAGGKFDVKNPYTTRSGYGTYVIGNAAEIFLGVTMEVGTYGTIFTGGSGYYGNLEAGERYDLADADGNIHTSYLAKEDVRTVINSDTFGFMTHKNDNEITLDGIKVNSGFTSFLVKSGNDTSVNIQNGTELNAGNGILLQLMDNDDATTEFDPEAMKFGMTHEEYAGFPTEAVKESQEAANDKTRTDGNEYSVNTTIFNVENTKLTGDLYNGIGWNANRLSSGNVTQMILKVNLKSGAVLNGAIASTSCVHASYDGQTALKSVGITAFSNETEAEKFASKYQLTSFGQSEYFNIGQVANLIKSNGLNNIDVTLTDDAVWNVTGISLIDSLSIEEGAKVVVEEYAALTVGNKTYKSGTYTAADF